MGLYRAIARPLLFRLEAERAHHLALAAAAACAPLAGPLRRLLAVDDPRLATDIAGLHFANPLGLAAGFDKSGTGIAALAALGFGAVEIGSVSVDASHGNPRPRLFRLPDDRAIVVHYGLPNDGIPAIAARLQQTRLPVSLGVNIVKTNRGRGAPPETADQIIAEYAEGARLMAPQADYLMLNLSCPNTEDGRDFFADAGNLQACLAALAQLDIACPVFLKVSPLGGIATIERVLAAAEPHAFIHGFMFNLPPVKPDGLATPAAVWRDWPGAVSGPPAAALADQCIREMYRRMDRRRHVIVGAGGVSTATDAYAKIRMGCSLVQLLTALVYDGPCVVRDILAGLAGLLERDGFAHVDEAVGADAR
jgi:dihydroorotate dehydrogenase (fumarate)/dihydroorotate dehydrogenase